MSANTGASAAGKVFGQGANQVNNDIIHIIIDGKSCECSRGQTLLEVCQQNGVFIPTLCHHPGLPGLGACRLCIVEVVERGRGKTVVSCIYPVEREIEVYTQNESIKEQRGVILTLLHHLAPEAEVITKMAAYLGVALPRLSDKPDGGKCVLCGRCTTACELMGSGAIAKVSRGVGKRIATPYDQASNECIGCGSCANVCPTGQIEYTQTEDSLSIWGKTFTLAHCSRCGASIGTAESYDYACQKANTSAGAEQPITHERLCEACERQATAALLKDSALRYDYARKC